MAARTGLADLELDGFVGGALDCVPAPVAVKL